MEYHDGGVIIKTKVEAKEARQELSALQKRMTETAKEMNVLEKAKMPTKEYAAAQKEVDKWNQKLLSALNAQERFLEGGGKENSATYKRYASDIEMFDRKLQQAEMDMQTLVEEGKMFEFGTDPGRIPQIEQQLAQYRQEQASNLAQQQQIQAALTEYEQKIGGVQNQYVSLQDAIRNAFGLMKSGLKDIPFTIVKKGIEGLKSAFSSLGSSAKNAFKSLGGAAKSALSKITGLFKSSSKSSAGLGAGLKGNLKTILKYGFGIRSLYVLVNKLRSALKEGFTNLYNSNLNGFKSQVDGLKGSLLTLKNAIAAAFSPIVSVAIPYIQKMISWLTAAVNAIGQVIAKLTGQKTYTRAIQQTTDATEAAADATNDAADATDNAAEAAEGYLSPLDEINKYETDKSSGSSSGGGGSGSSGSGTSNPIMFEEVPIDSKWADIADWLKQMWEDADFTELGTLIGTKLKNALDNIPWDGIQATARKIGSSIATLINGFVEVAGLGYTIGNTLAQAINTAFNFLNEFVHKLHWDSIGRFIAESLNGLFENIDWDLIKDTFVTGAKGLGDAINNFNDYFNWGAFANNVSSFFNTIIDTLYTFITTVDWKSLGENVGKTISDAFTGIDWGKAGKTVGEAFKAFFDFISSTIANVNWASVGESVREFLANIDWEGIIQSLYSSIREALGGFSDFIDGLFGDAAPAVKTFAAGLVTLVGVFGTVSAVASPLISIISSLTSPIGIVAAAIAGLVAVGVLLYQNWGTIKEKAGEIWNGIKTTISTVWNGIQAVTATVWNTIKNTVTTLWNGLKTTASTVFNAIKSVITTIMDGIKSAMASIWDGIKSATTTVWNGIKSAVTTAINTVKSGITTALNGIKSVWDTVWGGMKSTVTTIFDKIWTNIKSVINSILRGIESMANGVVSGINTVVRALNNLSFTIPSWVPTYGGKTFGFRIPTLSRVSLPRLAQGTVIPTGVQEYLAVLGDNNRETEVVSPLSTMKQALKEAAMEMGLTGSNNSTIVIKQYLDRKQIAESVIKEGKVQQMSTGKNIFSLA